MRDDAEMEIMIQNEMARQRQQTEQAKLIRAAEKERREALHYRAKFVSYEDGYRIQLAGYEQAQERVDAAFVNLRAAYGIKGERS